jgi:hypothetical protein
MARTATLDLGRGIGMVEGFRFLHETPQLLVKLLLFLM